MVAFVFLVIIATIISIMGRHRAKTTDRRQRGDTIVEVLISVIVIATILSGAFVVAQASSHNIQSSQEHGYALQQIQGQVEAIRSLAAQTASPLNSPPNPFCLYVSDIDSSIQITTPGDARCAGNQTLYTVSDTKGTTAASGAMLTTFTVDVSWPKLGGGTNHESLVYGVKLN